MFLSVTRVRRGAASLLALLLALPLHAQGVLGRISGTVTSTDGRPIPGATVQLVGSNTGSQRAATVDAAGRYTFLGVPNGAYALTARAIGVEPRSRDVRLEIGQTLRVDFTLRTGAQQLAGVTVQAEQVKPALPMRQTSVEVPVEEAQIKALPVLSRNILSLGALAPGARTYDGLAADFAVGNSQPGSATATGAVFGDFVIDGFSWKGRTAGSTITGNTQDVFLSMDAIGEARFVQYGYDAQFRGGTQVVVVNPKRGTNTFSGTAFANGFNQSLISRNPFQVGAVQDQNRYQFGATVTGPIVRDKLFFAVNVEGQRSDDPFNFRPSAPGFPAQFTQTATFRRGYTSAYGKLTWQASPAHTFDLAGNFRYDGNLAPIAGAFTPEIAWTQDQRLNVVYGKWVYTPAGNWSNEAIVSYQFNQWFTTAQSLGPGGTVNPMRIYQGGALITGPLNSLWPLRQRDRIARYTNNTTWFKRGWYGDHTVKFGGEVAWHGLANEWPKFLNPLVIYGGGIGSQPVLAQIGRGINNRTSDADVPTNATILAGYVQDEWQPTPRLTLNVGLRWSADLNNLLNDFTLPSDLAARVNAAGTRIPADFRMGARRPDDLSNFAPRLRFSYQLDEAGRTVLFGGYARSYERPPSNDVINAQLNANWRIYTLFFQPIPGGIPFTENAETLRAAAAGGAASPNLVLLRDRIRNPYFDDWSIGVNRQLTPTIAMSVNLVQKDFARGFGTYNVNLDPPGDAGRPIAGLGDVLLAGDFWRSRYRAVLVTMRKSFSGGDQFTAAYALGSARTDIMRPDQPTPFRLVPAVTDERHRLTLSGIKALPFGFQLSGVVTLASPLAFNATDGRDLNNNGVFTDDFPAGQGPNSFRPTGWTNWYRNVDARLTKRFGVGRYAYDLQVEAFNLLNTANYNLFSLNQNLTAGTPNPQFGTPIGGYLGRRIQVGTRFSF